MNVETMIFVPLLAFAWIWGFILALFLSHAFLTIFEDAAGGGERVIWQYDSVADMFWKVFWLGLILLTWGLPAVLLLLDAIRRNSNDLVISAIIWLWLLFPIGVLCSRSHKSPFVSFSAQLLFRLPQQFRALIGFYLLSAIPLVAFLLWIFSMGKPAKVLNFFLFPFFGAIGWLVYARILGRFGFLLMFTKGFEIFDRAQPVVEPKPKKKRPKRNEPAEGEAAPSRQKVSEMEPMTGALDGPVSGYDVSLKCEPEAEEPVVEVDSPNLNNRLQPSRMDPLQGGFDGPVSGYDIEWGKEGDLPTLGPIESPELTGEQKQHRPRGTAVKESELALHERSKRPQKPTTAYDTTLVSFLLQGDILKVVMLVVFAMTVLSGVAQLMISFRPPVGSGEVR